MHLLEASKKTEDLLEMSTSVPAMEMSEATMQVMIAMNEEMKLIFFIYEVNLGQFE